MLYGDGSNSGHACDVVAVLVWMCSSGLDLLIAGRPNGVLSMYLAVSGLSCMDAKQSLLSSGFSKSKVGRGKLSSSEGLVLLPEVMNVLQ